MSTSTVNSLNAVAVRVEVSDDTLTAELADGRLEEGERRFDHGLQGEAHPHAHPVPADRVVHRTDHREVRGPGRLAEDRRTVR